MKRDKTTAVERFATLGGRLKGDGRLQIDQAKLSLSEKIYALMQEKHVTEAELSRRLGSSRAYVNKVLQGDTNFTIESLVKIGLAFGHELEIEFADSQKQHSALKDDIIYIEVERPVEQPVVISASIENEDRNILDFTAYKATRTLKVGSDEAEGINAAIQDAA